MRIYLDTCCLNRPLDDQTSPRIRRETEGIRRIFQDIHARHIIWVASEILMAEIMETKDELRRNLLRGFLIYASEIFPVTDETVVVAQRLTKSGFRTADALHVACASLAGCDIFYTTDDRLLKTAWNLPDPPRMAFEAPPESEI